MNQQNALVLEGGGLRGVYTSGLLDALMERELYLPQVLGVSAGACNAMSYLSRQYGRNWKINVGFAGDPRYYRLSNLLKGESVFNMTFLFHDIPQRLVPFDQQRFHQAQERLQVVVTNCQTGQAEYLDNKQSDLDMTEAAKASSSLPYIGDPVWIRGTPCLDGGIADPIPVGKALEEKAEKMVVVLTQPRGYRKRETKLAKLAAHRYWRWPGLVRALKERAAVYNRSLEKVDALERQDRAWVFAPLDLNGVGRMEKSRDKLHQLYEKGLEMGRKQREALQEWLNTPPRQKCKAD